MPPVPRLQLSDRRLAAARRRRRRGQIRLAALVLAIIVVGLIVVSVAGGSSHTAPNSHSGAKPTATATATAAHHVASHATGATGATDPLSTRSVQRLLASREGKVSAAVENLTTGREWVLNPGARDQTASIVKANILEALLYQAQQNDTPLSDDVSDTAQGMIEASDNDDASDLWDAIGANTGLDAYDDKIGMTQTTGAAGGFWGETLTSAADQIKLLRQLALPHGVLSRASVKYQLSLMEDIDPGENWGVTGGVPSSGVTVALKNGWVPLTSNTDWEVNSIGWVHGDGHDYLVAVLTAHDPSEDYGINTIDAMSKDIYGTVGPAPAAGTPTIQVTPSG
jgi:hypothetical protein